MVCWSFWRQLYKDTVLSKFYTRISIPTPTTNSSSLEGTSVSDFENDIFIPQTFHGYPCTVDCSGHEAGYEWAEEKEITDPDDCGGNSQSFIEGYQSYAEENSDDGDSF